MEKEREEARRKAEEDLQLLREEALGERERLRKEVKETHRRLEEALQQQEQLKKTHEEMRSRRDATKIVYRHASRLTTDVNEAHPLSKEIMMSNMFDIRQNVEKLLK